MYGEDSLQDLETRVYAWALELGLQVRCRQTNHEGDYVEFLHDALGTADGLILNPGAWTHYSWAIRDALEPFSGPVVEVHISERRRARGMAPFLGARGPRQRARRRARASRATGEALELLSRGRP